MTNKKPEAEATGSAKVPHIENPKLLYQNQRKDATMEKIKIHRTNSKPIGKGGGCIWVSKEVNDTLDNLADETGIAKQRITDYLLKQALAVVEVVEDEL